MDSDNQLNTELESFRQQWLSDLQTKTPNSGPNRNTQLSDAALSQPPSAPSLSHEKPPHAQDDGDDDYLQAQAFDEPPAPAGYTLAGPSKPGPTKLVSALDHFEEAMEREAQGNMGDSLKLYRQAYKLDHGVDKRYREKHFPKSHPWHPKGPMPTPAPEPTSTTAAPEASSTTPTQPASQLAAEDEAIPLSITDLLVSFSTLAIEPSPPPVEGMPSPPSPISNLPDEILSNILVELAVLNLADFVRMSLVCKRLAWLVSSEQSVWRRACLGEEVGFKAMWHHWGTEVQWKALPEWEYTGEGEVVSLKDLQARYKAEGEIITRSLVPSETYPTWKAMFRHRPRIRFNGCYISTVNYIRTGQASTNQSTWGGSPVQIVTYYRYLRFFRDGTVISLVGTHEPKEVVHLLNKDELHLQKGNKDKGHTSILPSAAMQKAMKGRWRLSSALEEGSSLNEKQIEEAEGDLYIETEGIGFPKYTFRMDLSLRSAGKGARNNKLIWKGFWSHNSLTDDWAVFGLKNDKPFFFSRVKSYGFGE